jgi:D-inositol-3-phosphate glycosyltransferase
VHILMLSVIDDPFDPPGGERFGGGHLFVFDLGRYLIRKGHYITYLTRANDPGKSEKEQLGSMCTIHRLRVGPLSDVPPVELGPFVPELTLKSIALLDEIGSFDVIHSHYWLSGIVARELAARRPTHHVHSLLSLGRVRRVAGEESKLGDVERDRGEIRVFTEADRLIACCPAERRDLQTLYPEIPHNHICIVPYGVDCDVFLPRPESSRDYVRRTTRRFAQGAADVP